jgi:pyroglutamyl-peptidase
MTATILLTGFGPFPGAPFNPTGALVTALAQRRYPGLRHVRRIAHVFASSYAAVDRELPALLTRERPDALVMFGLASRSRHIRIETRGRNLLTTVVPDASGHLPTTHMITPDARATLSLRVPAQMLVAAARRTGIAAALSHDAGSYLCNYLCWRAGEALERDGVPRLIAFVHVPKVRGHRPRSHGKSRHTTGVRMPSAHRRYRPRSRPPIAFEDLVRAGEAIMLAAIAAPPTRG